MVEFGAAEGLRLAGDAARLDDAMVGRVLDAARGQAASQAYDVGDYDSDGLRDLLRRIGPRAGETVDVVWGDERLGVRMEWVALVASIDDLWAPSSTDLVIRSRDGLLHIDHEEVVRVYP